MSPLLSVMDVLLLLLLTEHTKMDADVIVNSGRKYMANASKVHARFDVWIVRDISPLYFPVLSPLETNIVSNLSPSEADIVSELSPLEAGVLV